MNKKGNGERGGEVSFSAQRKVKRLEINDFQPFLTPEADTLLSQFAGMKVMPLPKCIIMEDYLPARLVRAKKRWFFSYYQTDPATGKRVRHRETFDINRIPLDKRAGLAKTIVDSINSKLPFGYPYDQDFYARHIGMPIIEAFSLVTTLGSDLRHATVLSYAYSMRKFETYLIQAKLINQDISAITKKVALAYSAWLTKSGLKARSHNNDINEMRRVFNVLKTQEIISVNPFDGIPKKRVEEKERRCLDPAEARAILNYLREVDKSVYLSCALLYFCLIRPNEQRFLQRKDVLLESSIINIKGSISKNHKSQPVTIPEQLKELLIDIGIETLHPDEFIIGFAAKIGNSRPVGKSSASNRYRNLRNEMFKKKLITSIDGNVLYSWKDTGADGMRAAGVDAFTLKDQGRWHSLTQAQAYLSKRTSANQFVKDNHRL